MESLITFVVILLSIVFIIGMIFVVWVLPVLICYKKAYNKDLFNGNNWIAILIGLIFGWLGVLAFMFIK